MTDNLPSSRETIRTALEHERTQTAARLASLDRAFAELVAYSEGTPPDDEHDPEGATIGWERAQVSALREQAREQLRELGDAITRLELGSYGSCERCGASIAPARLAARPASRLCITCAARG